MAKRNAYAEQFAREKTPVVDGIQYRAVDAGKVSNACPECVAEWNDLLCRSLPPCSKASRLDGLNVRYVDCGKAAGK